MKNNKGITLIALVVTIIVLLILAGVSIAMLTGQNGILNRGQEAAYKNAVTDAKDQISLKVAECITNWNAKTYAGVTTTGIADDDTLDSYIVKELNKLAPELRKGNVTVKFKPKTGDASDTATAPADNAEVTITVASTKKTTVTTVCTWKVNGDLSAWTDTGI